MTEETAGIRIEIEEDAFNSKHFGLKMGNMTIQQTQEGEAVSALEQAGFLAHVEAEAAKEGFEHLTCKIDPNHKNCIYALENRMFLLTDTLITNCYDFTRNLEQKASLTCEVGDVQERDVPTLMEIARSSYQMDRFHSDPTLPNELCDQYYERWIENCCHGFADVVKVGYLDGKPVGYAAAKYTPGEEYIQFMLVAVDPRARGRGVHTSMKYAKLEWARQLAKQHPSIKGILDGTQIGNIEVQRTWAKVGFIPFSSRFVFQKKIV